MDYKKTHNLATCTCTYAPCPHKGVCCKCISFHLRNRELPGCCFPAAAERTYDRSFEYFARLVQSGQG